MTGSDDRLTPASVVRKTAALIGPTAELREFAGHGHWVVGKPGWERVAGFVAEWLDAHAGAPASAQGRSPGG